jgi:hypothetical protein
MKLTYNLEIGYPVIRMKSVEIELRAERLRKFLKIYRTKGNKNEHYA